MADLAAVTANEVAAVEVIEQFTGPAGEAIDAGEIVGIDDATGAIVLADADAVILPKGIAIKSANAAGLAITAVRRGIVDVGDVLDGLDYGDSVFLSDTPGLMADAAVGGLAAIGEVTPVWGHTTADKALRIAL
jgi:hypothetical protein